MSDKAPTTFDFSIPYVIEKTGRGERTYDLYSRLMEDRIIFIGTEINDMVANVVVAQLLFLHKMNKTQDVQMYINSPGWRCPWGSRCSGPANSRRSRVSR